MDHSTQVTLLRRLFAFLDAQTTELAPAPYVNDVSTYTSAAQLERERALLFGRQPLLVGLSSDLADPGAYLVHGDSGIPILVVRSQSRQLHACLALCRHRGAPVVTGSESAPAGSPARTTAGPMMIAAGSCHSPAAKDRRPGHRRVIAHAAAGGRAARDDLCPSGGR